MDRLLCEKLGEDKVFFYERYPHRVAGSDADTLLQTIYAEKSVMVVPFFDQAYKQSEWCVTEWRAIRDLDHALSTSDDPNARLRILPVRFDDTKIPGVLKSTIYIDARTTTAPEVAKLILKRLAELSASTPSPSTTPHLPPPVAHPSSPSPPILFVHPATNDEYYSRREKELAWLDACAQDPYTRIATVTGIGGLGKTSLVGHWISVHHGWQHRAFRGVFFYSFYSNRDPNAFFAAFLDFVCKVQQVCFQPNRAPLHHLAAGACKRWPYLVVLDGLEVLQQGEDDPNHGWINDSELTEFVARVGEAGHSLLVLTSRFTFPQVTRTFTHNARALALPLLTPPEGATLLARCGLEESQSNLERYSAQFGGHPLALRIFAGACKAEPLSDPEEVSAEMRADHGTEALPDPQAPGIDEEERQKRRQRRQFYKLLTWYQGKLSTPKRGLLQLVALFKEPVPTETLIALAQGMEDLKASFAGEDRASLLLLLETLVAEHLLQREDEAPGSDIARWSAHPIVRDVFREAALHAGDKVAQQFAEIVAGKGEDGTPKTVAQLQPILEAVEVLLAAGDFKAADRLYRGRLHNGYVFRDFPAPQEGLRCARAFVKPRERWAAVEQALGRERVAFYLNVVAFSGSSLGEMEGVERGYKDYVTINHTDKRWSHLSAGFQNIADVQIFRGALREAAANADETLYYAGVEEAAGQVFSARCFLPRPPEPPEHDAKNERNSRAYRAHALALAGELPAASRDFTAADKIERENDPDNDALYSIRGIQWCRHRVRLGEQDTARQLTLANRAICERYGWNSTLARCDLFLGELHIADGSLASAEERLSAALKVFRDARQGKDLPDALLAMARLRRAKGSTSVPPVSGKTTGGTPALLSTDDESAQADANEALRMARRSGLRLIECDILNFLALLHREAGDAATALTEAREALRIADDCGYYWGKHEALRQLRDASQAAGKTADARNWDLAEKELAKKMQPLIEEAIRINQAHDAEMAKLYPKKEEA